jgi:hypothetical protein
MNPIWLERLSTQLFLIPSHKIGGFAMRMQLGSRSSWIFTNHTFTQMLLNSKI